MERLVIHTSDIVKITGYSESWAARKLKEVRAAIGKKKNELVTFDEFYQHTGIKR